MIQNSLTPSDKSKKGAPSWLNVDEVNKAVQKEKDALNQNIKKTASVINTPKEIILSYSCPRCMHTHYANSSTLIAQANLMKAKLQKEGQYRCPDCKAPLEIYETTASLTKTVNGKYAELIEKRVDLQKEAGYNTIVDRILMNKALDAVTKYASKNGMTLPIARYKNANRIKEASHDLERFDRVDVELEWRYGRNQVARVEASINIDSAGVMEMPRMFKVAGGSEFPFERKYVEAVEKELRERDIVRKPKNSDFTNVRKPDPTRFRSTNASLQKEANTMQPQTVPGQSSQPGLNNQPQNYQPNQQIVNPADGKAYQVVSQDPTKGLTVMDPQTQQQSVIPANQVQNVKPALTTSSLVQELVEDTLKKKSFSITAIVNDILNDEGISSEPLSKEEIPNEVVDHLKQDIQEDKAHGDKLNELAQGELHESPPEPDEAQALHDLAKDEFDETAEDTDLMHRIMNANKKYTNVNAGHLRVASMSQNWASTRKALKEKKRQEELQALEAAKGENPTKLSFQQQIVDNLVKQGYKGFKPENNEKTESGRTENGVPVGESGEIEIGMTDYPDYTKPFSEAQEDALANREHFKNENKLPINIMKRDELSGYVKGKDDEKNYGLSGKSEKGDYDNPKLQFEAAQSIAKDLVKEAMEEGVLPDGSGFFTATVGDDESSKKEANAAAATYAIHRQQVHDYISQLFAKYHHERVQEIPEATIISEIEKKFDYSPELAKKVYDDYKQMKTAGILPNSPFPDNLMDAQIGDVDAYLDEKAASGTVRGNGWSVINEVASKFPNVDKSTIKQRMIEKGMLPKYASEDPVTSIEDKALDNAMNDIPVIEKPVVYKENKKAPNLEGADEPPAIDFASGKTKEAITKLRNAQAELSELKAKMDADLKPFQESLQKKQQEYAPDVKVKTDAVNTYINMAYDQLRLIEGTTAAYEKEIYMAVQRSKAEAGSATLAEILKKAEESAPAAFEAIKKIKAEIENSRTKEVIEKYLYSYPQSKSHEKKIKNAADESGRDLNELVAFWSGIVKELLDVSKLFL